ncbi:MAG: cyclic peptide export ABC transporter, partial [Acidobacteria bacterium]|nr:cyclic peptide export ABC transporter [Acidobacteriota bacterium]
VYLGWLSWRLLSVLSLFIVLGIVCYQLPVKWALRRQRQARKEADTMFRYYRGVLDGTKELKLHAARRAGFLSRLDVTGRAFQGHNVSAATIYSSAASFGQMLAFVVVGLVLFLSWRVVPGLSREVLTGYALVLLYLTTPLQVMLEVLRDLAAAEVALRNVEDLGFSLLDKDKEQAAPPAPAARWRSVELRRVEHRFAQDGQDDLFTLGPIDFTLHPGELVFLVGGNGSGKTTLAKLLIGLYQPEAGQLLMDGEAVWDAGVESYRQHFSVVFSDFYLFETLFGLENAELDAKARAYLERLRIANKVKVQDGTLSTTQLSHGQRKRLALLTAYLEDRPIYVFDEWAADQDPAFKDVFYLQLLPELKARGKTVLVISHDDSYYGVADRIVKLDYGRIVFDRRREEAALQGVPAARESMAVRGALQP